MKTGGPARLAIMGGGAAAPGMRRPVRPRAARQQNSKIAPQNPVTWRAAVLRH